MQKENGLRTSMISKSNVLESNMHLLFFPFLFCVHKTKNACKVFVSKGICFRRSNTRCPKSVRLIDSHTQCTLGTKKQPERDCAFYATFVVSYIVNNERHFSYKSHKTIENRNIMKHLLVSNNFKSNP